MNRAKFVQKFVNRNPRNLERLRLQRKSDGWDFELSREMKNFMYRADFLATKNHIAGSIFHYENGIILEASTREKGVQSQLNSCIDANAALNIGRLLAHRCKMAGILSCIPGVPREKIERSERRTIFFKALEEGGIKLQEPECIPHTHLNDPDLVWEPGFELHHNRDDKLDELDLSLAPGKGVC